MAGSANTGETLDRKDSSSVVAGKKIGLGNWVQSVSATCAEDGLGLIAKLSAKAVKGSVALILFILTFLTCLFTKRRAERSRLFVNDLCPETPGANMFNDAT